MLMKKTTYFLQAAAFAALFLLPSLLLSWGFWAHKAITRQAISVLPAEAKAFFVEHADSISEKSIDPDLWRRHDDKEGNRHFIDIDNYGAYPFADLPRDYNAAVDKYGEEQVYKMGIVPWRVAEMLDSLTTAMKARDKKLMIRYTTAVAHYVEDIHMPLHTVVNYDGQLSGNKGIHSRYERWMLEAHPEEVLASIQPNTPQYIDNVRDAAFAWVLDSFIWADNLLHADSHAKVPGKSYSSREDYDSDYYARLYQNTRAFTGLQLSKAATATASCWLTAWVNAGKPDLSGL